MIFVPEHSETKEKAQDERQSWDRQASARRNLAHYRRTEAPGEVEIIELDGSEAKYQESRRAAAKRRELILIEAHGVAGQLCGVCNTYDGRDGTVAELWPDMSTDILVVAACDQTQPYAFTSEHRPGLTARFTGTLAGEYARTIFVLGQFLQSSDFATDERFHGALREMHMALPRLSPNTPITKARAHRPNRLVQRVQLSRTVDLVDGGTGVWQIDRR